MSFAIDVLCAALSLYVDSMCIFVFAAMADSLIRHLFGFSPFMKLFELVNRPAVS